MQSGLRQDASEQHAKEAKLRGLLESAPDGIVVEVVRGNGTEFRICFLDSKETKS